MREVDDWDHPPVRIASVCARFLLVLIGICCVSGVSLAQQAFLQADRPERGAQAKRREQLLEALKGENPPPRAVEELALMGIHDAPARKALLALVRKQGEGSKRPEFLEGLPFVVSYSLVDGLAAPGAEAVPDILEALGAANADESKDHYLTLASSLGRIGAPAKRALPFLRAKLADRAASAELKAAIRVILANLGDQSKETLEAILANLRDEKLQRPTAQVIVLVRAREWVSEAMIQAMGKWLHRDLELDVPVALGILGAKAERYAGTLEKIFDRRIDAGDGLALAYGLVVANIDPTKRDAVLRRLLNNFDRIGDCRHGWLILTAVSNAYALVPPLSKELVKLCEDKDERVAGFACGLLASASLSVREVAPELIKFTRGKGDEEVRAAVAYALRDIAEYSHLPQLDEALKKESSAKVRKNLGATIKYIKTFEPVTWYGPPEW